MTIAQDTPNSIVSMPQSVFVGEDSEPTSVPVEVMLRGVWRALPQISLVISLASLLTILWLHFFAVPRYTAHMTVTTYIDSATGVSGSSTAGISAILGGGPSSNPNFNLYIQTRKSVFVAQQLLQQPEVREHLFRSQWDAKHDQWHAPRGHFAALTSAIRGFLGLPPWSPPDASDLQKILLKKIISVQDPLTLSYTFSYTDRDPAFAEYLLREIHEIAEDHLREGAETRASLQINHLLGALPQSGNDENRVVLSELLLQQQQQLMRINPAMPYAAIVVDPPTAGREPSSPAPFLDLAIAISVSGFLTALFAAWRASKVWVSKQRL